MSKWLIRIVIGIGIMAVLTGILLWVKPWLQRAFGSGREQEIQAITQAAKDSLASAQRRIDSLTVLSGRRDTIVDSAAVEERAHALASDLASDRIAQLRHQLGTMTEVRDRNVLLVQLDIQQEHRHTADTIRINRLRLIGDTLRADRDDWKRAAGQLLAFSKKLTGDINRLAEIASDQCNYLIVKLPCPAIVAGVGGQLNGHGALSAGLQVTGGIPIRLGRRSAPSAPPEPGPLPGPLSASDTAVVSVVEE